MDLLLKNGYVVDSASGFEERRISLSTITGYARSGRTSPRRRLRRWTAPG